MNVRANSRGEKGRIPNDAQYKSSEARRGRSHEGDTEARRAGQKSEKSAMEDEVISTGEKGPKMPFFSQPTTSAPTNHA